MNRIVSARAQSAEVLSLGSSVQVGPSHLGLPLTRRKDVSNPFVEAFVLLDEILGKLLHWSTEIDLIRA